MHKLKDKSEKKRNITGVGILLRTNEGKFLLQERDNKTKSNPGRIAPFGGGTEKGETAIESALRELREELDLELNPEDLMEVDIFGSHILRGEYIQIFLSKKPIDSKKITLREGKAIREMQMDEILDNSKVTDFTKKVISRLSTLAPIET